MTKIDYQFVAFPSLGLNFITQDICDNTNNNIFPYASEQEDYPDFPILKHHSHPYLAIANALPKFDKYRQDLTNTQIELYATLLRIVRLWNKRLHPPSHKQHMGNSDVGPSDHSDEYGSHKGRVRGKKKGAKPLKKRTKQAPTAGKGQGQQLKHKVMKKFCQPPQVLYPKPLGGKAPLSFKDDNNADFCFEKQQSIIAWIANVAAAGPPKPVGENAIVPNGEIGQAPFTGNWHTWCYPWIQPPKRSNYCSNDWAMDICMFKLTAEPYYDISDEDDSDISDGVMSFSS